MLEEGRNQIFCSRTIFCKHKLVSCETFYNKASSPSSTEFQTACPNHRFSIPRSVSVCHVDLAVRASPWHGTDSNRTRNNSRLRTNSVWHPNIELQSGKVLHPLFEKDWQPVLRINTAIFWLAGAARVSSFERRAAFSPSPACATAAFRRAQPGVPREQARDGRVLQ